jgi:transcriptional regulator with XRE-family HTH domain
MTQEQLAAMIGLSQSHMSRLEFSPNPRDATIRRVADALAVPFEQLKPWRTVRRSEPRREWPGLQYLRPAVRVNPKLHARVYLASPDALRALRDAGQKPIEFLNRHTAGDWGDVTAADAARNDAALVTGAPVISRYTTHADAKLLIVTDAIDGEFGERDQTRIILPEEHTP